MTHVIHCDHVDDAYRAGVRALVEEGVRRESRNGPVIEYPAPVVTVYHRPANCISTLPARRANPFFHVVEAAWILLGRRDVTPLVHFNRRIADYSDDGEKFHAAYGYRLRNGPGGVDQIEAILDLLRRDPMTRRAVATIWRPDLDMPGPENARDLPCNDLLDFKIDEAGRLHLRVYCRSNDMIWGAYGANVVQFSFLLRYVAERLGAAVGTYTQISSSFHVYLDGPGGDIWRRLYALEETGWPPVNYDAAAPLTDDGAFDYALTGHILNNVRNGAILCSLALEEGQGYSWPRSVLLPLVIAWNRWREYTAGEMKYEDVRVWIEKIECPAIRAGVEAWIRETLRRRVDEPNRGSVS